jgi:hypothetical protein
VNSRRAARLRSRAEACVVTLFVAGTVKTATLRSAGPLDGFWRGAYARLRLPVQCIILLILYAIWR